MANAINETISLNSRTWLEIDFNRIEYADGHKGPSWLTAELSAAEVRNLCGKGGSGSFSVTEDELEAVLKNWLTATIKAPVISFRWIWDTFRKVEAA